MPLAALIPAVAGIGSAVIGGISANSAAKTQANAATQASQTQLQMYNQTRSDLQPYMQTGNAAMSQLAQLFGLNVGGAGGAGGISPDATKMLQNTPGYQFMYGEGLQGLDRSAASKGMLLSGAQLKDAQTYGQGAALAGAWQPYVTQLNALSSLGENAGAQVGNQGTSAAQAAGGYQQGAGEARASGQIATGNILQQGLSSLGSQLQGYYGSGGAGAPTTYNSAFSSLQDI